MNRKVLVGFITAVLFVLPCVASSQSMLLLGAGGKTSGSGGSAPIVQTSAVSLPTAASSVSATVTKPSGTVSGDLLLFAYSPFFITSFTSYTPPSGLTLIDSQCTPGYPCLAVYYKIAGGSEPASYTFTASGSGPWNGGATAIRITGQNATTPINVSAKQVTASGATGNFPTATTTVANTLIIHLAGGSFIANPTGSQWPTIVPSGYTTVTAATDTASSISVGSDTKTLTSAGSIGAATVATATIDSAFSAMTVAIAP